LLTPADAKQITLLETPLQEVPLSTFEALEANDILFIDSTHVCKTGSDVNRLIFEILPRLQAGVYIHIHDMFYPFEYPKSWVLEGRAWNELYLVRAFLQNNDTFEIAAFNNYLTLMHRDWFQQHMPLCLKNTGGSLWLRKCR
jgi:hypothetical protein